MSNAEIRSIFTDENSIFIDENTPLYTYCGSGDRACLYASTGRILFTLKGYLFRYNFWLYTFIVLFIIILIEKYHGKNMAEIY